MELERRIGIASLSILAILPIACGRSDVLGVDPLVAAGTTGSGTGAGTSSSNGAGGAGATGGAVTGAGGAIDGSGGDETVGAGASGGGSADGSGGSGGGGIDPLGCFTCVTQSCPAVLSCIQDPVCAQGLFCSFSQCLGGGAPDLMCVADCFGGDFGAALDALQALGCLFTTCGDACGGLLPGGFPPGN